MCQKHLQPAWRRLANKTEVRFTFYAFGIFFCYYIFGMLQEKITRGTYGANDRYTSTLCLVLVQCLVNYVFAQILMLSWKHEKDSTRTVYYISTALTYLLAMVASNYALRYISYPTQVVGKAAKPIPVLILGVLIGRKSYPLRKYLFVVLIVVGVALFLFNGNKSHEKKDGQFYGLGEVMLLLSLTMDGFTGAVQDRIKSESSPTAYSMMVNTNMWSTIMVTFAVLITGEITQFVAFVKLYPIVLLYLAGLAVLGAVGQLFIFFMVAEFGSLPCAVVTTTRKFFTMLTSIIFFGNAVVLRQWIGAVLVFLGLFLDIYFSRSRGQPKRTPEKLIKDPVENGTIEEGKNMKNGNGIPLETCEASVALMNGIDTQLKDTEEEKEDNASEFITIRLRDETNEDAQDECKVQESIPDNSTNPIVRINFEDEKGEKRQDEFETAESNSK